MKLINVIATLGIISLIGIENNRRTRNIEDGKKDYDCANLGINDEDCKNLEWKCNT